MSIFPSTVRPGNTFTGTTTRIASVKAGKARLYYCKPKQCNSIARNTYITIHDITSSYINIFTLLTINILNMPTPKSDKSPRQLVDDGQYHGRKRRSIRRRLIGRTDMLQPNITREYDGLVNLQSGSPSPTI